MSNKVLKASKSRPHFHPASHMVIGYTDSCLTNYMYRGKILMGYIICFHECWSIKGSNFKFIAALA